MAPTFTSNLGMCIYPLVLSFSVLSFQRVFWVQEFKCWGRVLFICTWSVQCYILQPSWSFLFSSPSPAASMCHNWSTSQPEPRGLLTFLTTPFPTYSLHKNNGFILLIFEFPESNTLLWHIVGIHCIFSKRLDFTLAAQCQGLDWEYSLGLPGVYSHVLLQKIVVCVCVRVCLCVGVCV